MFDLVLVLIFALMAFLGWKNGFAKSVMGLLGYVIAIALAYYAYQPVAKWLMSTPYASWAAKLVEDNVVRTNVPLQSINLTWIPDGIRTGLETAARIGVNAATEQITMSITQVFVALTALVLVFVIAFIVLKTITFIVNILVKFPVLSLFNKVFGMLVGIINGVLLVYIIVLISNTLTPYIPEVGEVCRQSTIREIFQGGPISHGGSSL